MKNPVSNRRAVAILFVALLLFTFLLGRFLFIQTAKEVKGHNVQQLGEERWATQKTLKGIRGTIYDRAGSALAEELNSYTVYAVLDEDQNSFVDDPRKVAEQLAPYVEMEVAELEKLLSADKFQVELGAKAKNLTHERMEEIKDLDLNGIYFREEPKRYYPKQTFASHVIGYTERDMETSRMGLEKSLDDLLRAEDGMIHYQSDRKGIPLPDPKRHVSPAKNGYDVYLTIDAKIQTALEQVLSKVDEQYEPNKMIAIVADPKTGEILAMGNRPSFNPNHYEDITNFINYGISEHFEPGSTMKMFTVAAAIEEGVYNGQEWYDSGRYQIGRDAVRDHNQGRGWGSITFDEGFLRSSNVAMAKLALEKLTAPTFYSYWEKFGFMEPTGIDLPNEAGSLIAEQSNIDTAASAFGQATAVTPIQQIQAATAIANNGKMMKPYVVNQIVNSETKTVVEKKEPEVVGEPISEKTAKQVLGLLGEVVTSTAGTGKPYYIEGFDVAGKTGTAQIPNPNGKGYLKGRGQNIYSFLGMAPEDDPQLIVYVAVDRPNLEPHEAGSEPSAMIFNTIMKQSLQYLNIAPDFTEEAEKMEDGFTIENFKGKQTDAMKSELEEEGMEVIVLGSGGKIEEQTPVEGSRVLVGERIFLRTNNEDFEMPNIEGWSIRDVRKLTNVLEMNPTIFGHGYVTKQSIEPDSRIQVGDYIVIELAKRKEVLEENEDETEEEEERQVE